MYRLVAAAGLAFWLVGILFLPGGGAILFSMKPRHVQLLAVTLMTVCVPALALAQGQIKAFEPSKVIASTVSYCSGCHSWASSYDGIMGSG